LFGNRVPLSTQLQVIGSLRQKINAVVARQ
jgi:hypothetical protein